MKNNRVLIIHNRGYMKSGPERFISNFSQLMNEHDISLFCLDYSQNNMSECLEDLPQPLLDNGAYSISSQNLNLLTKVILFFKTLFNYESFKILRDHLSKNNYDYIVVCQFQFKLTPSIFLAIKKYANNSKLFIRSSDYFISCVRNTFTDKNNNICMKCNKNRFSSVINRCNGNLFISFHRFFGNYILHRMLNYVKPDLLFTNEFALSKFIENKYLKNLNKHVVHTPDTVKVDVDLFSFGLKNKNYDFIFFGRISKDKGFKRIYDLFINNNFTLVIVGSVDEDCKHLFDELILSDRIFYYPFLPKDELLNLINKSRFSLLFSCWFDNLPNSLIESYSQGVPVICYDFGSFSEFIPEEYRSFYKMNYSNNNLNDFMNLDYEAFQKSVLEIHSNKFSPNNFINKFTSI